MPVVKLGNSGQYGVNKDLSNAELPSNVWTTANNIRFIDGMAQQAYGYREIYASPSVVPYHVLPVMIGSTRYLVLAGTGKIYCVTGSTYTDLTRGAGGDYSGDKNTWTSTSLSGIPILNDGSGANYPQSWDLDTANNFGDLANWPANTYCKSIRAYKNYLIALNITKTTTNYPYLVKWSNGADAGAVPSSWDETDPSVEAGENDLAAEGGEIVDGGALRNDFIIYKQHSMWRMTFVGGQFIFSFAPISNTQGLLTKNAWVEMDGYHLAVTGSDVVIHDGQTVSSILDKSTRKYFFSQLDPTNYDQIFCFRSPYTNEVCVAYPEIGEAYCNKLLVYNTVDKTVSFRDVPDLLHANSGLMEASAGDQWNSDSSTWNSDSALWNDMDMTPDAARTVWASADQKLYMMDSGLTANGTAISSTLERIGLTFGAPESMKLIKGVRPRIKGEPGDTVIVSVGGSNDPYATPTYTTSTHTIGTTVSDDLLVSGRYISLKLTTGTAAWWRVDSIDVDVDLAGEW